MTYETMPVEFKNFVKTMWDFANHTITGKKVEHATAAHFAIHAALDNAGLPKGDARTAFLTALD